MAFDLRLEKPDDALLAGVREEDLALLCPERREKYARMKHPGAAVLSYTAGRLLTEVLCEKLCLTPDTLELAVGPQGKPYVPGHESFYFNLTHTDGLCVLAYGDEPVGVDCERLRFRERDKKVAGRCFCEAECTYIEEAGPDEALFAERFFRVWTMKESYLKYTGKGISVPLSSFCVDPGRMCVRDVQAVFHEKRYEDYMIMVCTGGSRARCIIKRDKEDEIMDGFNGGGQQPYGMPQQPQQQQMGGQPYGAPQAGYGMPQAGYGAPQQGYGMPQQPYGMPQQPYGMPQQGYGLKKPMGASGTIFSQFTDKMRSLGLSIWAWFGLIAALFFVLSPFLNYASIHAKAKYDDDITVKINASVGFNMFELSKLSGTLGVVLDEVGDYDRGDIADELDDLDVDDVEDMAEREDVEVSGSPIKEAIGTAMLITRGRVPLLIAPWIMILVGICMFVFAMINHKIGKLVCSLVAAGMFVWLALVSSHVISMMGLGAILLFAGIVLGICSMALDK